MEAKNAIVNWLWNFRVCVLLKGAVPEMRVSTEREQNVSTKPMKFRVQKKEISTCLLMKLMNLLFSFCPWTG